MDVREIPAAVAGSADCDVCTERLRVGLARHRGVDEVTVRPGGRTLTVSYDPEQCSPGCLDGAVDGLRDDLRHRFDHHELAVGGMDCFDCARTIEHAVRRVPGVADVVVDFPGASMRVELEPAVVALDAVAERVSSLGYRVGAAAASRTPEGRRDRGRHVVGVVISGALLAGGLIATVLGTTPAVVVAFCAAAIGVGGWPVARAGIAALRATRRPDINLLMTIAVIGAAAIGAWVEAGLVVVLFSVGNALEGRAVERARRELASLVSLAPQTARVVRGGGADGEPAQEVEVPVAALGLGDDVVVRPGERIPVDGRILEGSSAVDQAPITGESTPVDKGAGDPVYAGTLNTNGRLIVRVTSPAGDTTLDRIGRLVREAQAQRSPAERWVDGFARFYTPAVMAAALLTAVVPLALGADAGDALYRALALLILACPCALVISTPVAIVSALGRASAAGVLVKGGLHLESAALIDAVAFDKTGTLTTGRPRLSALWACDGDEGNLLSAAASVEQGSEHPLAAAVVRAAGERGIALQPIEQFSALPGLGARAVVKGEVVEVASPRLVGSDALPGALVAAMEALRSEALTLAVVRRGGRPLGVLGLGDTPRPEAAEALADLKRLKIPRTVLLTGDNPATAAAIAGSLGVSEFRADLLPDDKSRAVASLGPRAAMVGDGVNDAPALAAARLGVAMGSAGSDTAIEVADVALMGDDPRKVGGLIGLARWTRTVVRQNVAFSLSTKLIAVAFLVAGALPLWAAVAADVGASLVVVANGLRLLRGRPYGRARSLPLLSAPGGRGADTVTPGEPNGPGPAANDACGCCAPAPTVDEDSGCCAPSPTVDEDCGCCAAEPSPSLGRDSGRL